MFLLNYWWGGMFFKSFLLLQVRQFLTTTVSSKNEDELLPTFAPPRTATELSAIESIIDDSDEEHDDAKDEVYDVSIQAPANERPVELVAPVEHRAIALYEYSGTEEGSLKMSAGDALIVITRDVGADWCYCKRVVDGVEGWCPVQYIHDDEYDV
jgi:hypothetical protein